MLASRRLRSLLGELRLMPWFTRRLEHGEVELAAHLIVPLLPTWLADPFDRRALAELHARLHGAHGPLDDDHLHHDILAALRSGLLFAALRRPALPQFSAESHATRPDPSTPGPTTELATWLEIRLVDELGDPLPDIPLSFDLNRGLTRTRTDSAGVARIDASSRSASVRLDDEAALRELLRGRWSQPRGRRWFTPTDDPARTTIVQVRRTTPFAPTHILAAEPHTLVFQPRVVQADLKGVWFATGKCFVLPAARHTLQRVTELYAQNPECDLLIVGHTDRTGSPQLNDPLSLARAESVSAYLRDDVDAWYAWYAVSGDQRWGVDEDIAMITALADERGEPIPDDPVRWYQRTRGLTIDGLAGPITRHALIAEYMQLDATTLPPDLLPVCHGCGESFPTAGKHATTPEDRRVEIFFFDNPIAPPDRPGAVLPPPPGPLSHPGAREYPEWLLRVRERHEFIAGQWIRLLMRYDDGTPAQNVAFTIRYSNGAELVTNTSKDGLLMIHASKELTWSILDVHDDSVVTGFQ